MTRARGEREEFDKQVGGRDREETADDGGMDESNSK